MTDGHIQNLNGFSIGFFCSHSAHNVTDGRIQNLNGFSIGFFCSHFAHNVTDGRIHRLPTSVGSLRLAPIIYFQYTVTVLYLEFLRLDKAVYYMHRAVYTSSLINIRDVTIHNLDVSIYCHLCITIQRYIAQYN